MPDSRIAAEPVRLEVCDDRFRPLVQANALLETLGEGFGWLEGPVWFADHRRLYVSDLPGDRILAWNAGAGISTFLTPAGFPNGKARDREGRLLVCSHHDRCVYRTERNGARTVLADSYRGERLNAPNDITCAADGAIWFTDPIYGLQNVYEGGPGKPGARPAVYRLDPGGELTAAVDDVVGPNGLAFSPNGRMLYVSETGDQYTAAPDRFIRRFMVGEDGALSGGNEFARISPGYADGFRVDEGGRLWVGAGDGVHCLDAQGVLLGKILTQCSVQNLCFGGRGGAQLFLCATHTLMSVFTNTRSALPF